nr:immunoglobulin heavy chain [Equus caballus]
MRLLCLLLFPVTAPQGVLESCPRSPVPGTAAGVGPRTGADLTDPVPHRYCHWRLRHKQLY